MADTIGMTLVLKADAKGVVAEMKNAQGAVIDTARIMRSQLSSASQQATGDLSKLKEGMGRARETAMFFTQSLQGFGPAGQMAQTALAGIGGAMLGGGGVLAALSLAKVAVELLSNAWQAEAKAAQDAAKKNLDAAKTIADAAAASAKQKTLEADRKLYTERFLLDREFQERLKAMNLKIAEQRRADGDDVSSAAVKDLVAERTKLVEAYQQEKEALKRLEAQAKSERTAAAGEKAAGQTKTPQQFADERQKATVEYMAGIQRELKAEEEAASERGRVMLAEQEADLNRVKALQLAAQRVQAEWTAAGQAISGAFSDIGTIIGGAASSWMGYFGQLIQRAIQLGIAMSAMSGPWGWLTAAAAGVSLLAAVTSVPEFRALGGPVAAGAPYIVGERGPELMVPGQSGTIVPNNALGGGGITINLHATDAKSVRRLLLDNQPALAEAIGKAVRDGRRFG